jgi:Fe2+ or Zn2+ uptake regulation protein
VKRSLPKNYQTIYAAIQAAGPGRHVSAYELFVLLRELPSRISQTTVYRALERLVEVGLIDQVAAPSAGHVVYELAAPAHAHFHCRMCGTLQDVELEFSQSELFNQGQLDGASIERTNLMLEGVCATCR